MRILMLAQAYPPQSGATAHHVQTLSAQLAKRGHAVAIATLAGPGQPPAEEVAAHQTRIYRMQGRMQRSSRPGDESGQPLASPLPDPGLILSLQRIIAREQPQIVHGHDWLLRSYLPLKGWAGARSVLTLHDHSLRCPAKHLIYSGEQCSGPSLTRCVRCTGARYGRASALPLVLGHRAASVATRFSIDAFVPLSQAGIADNGLSNYLTPLRVVPDFVPEYTGNRADDPHLLLAQLPPDEFLLFIGAFSRTSGMEVLLQTYAGITGAPPLVIISDEPPARPAGAIAFPRNVTFVHGWPRAAVAQAWQRCMFGIVPTTWSDPRPAVAMQAVAMGKPLVASRIGGLSDLVHDGVTGLLVPPGDPSALRAAIARLIADPGLRAHMGLMAQRKALELRASAVAEQIEQLYSDLVQRRRRA